MANTCEPANDLLSGAREIAAYMRMSERRVRYLDERKLLPVFWIGKRMMARKSTLKAYLDRLEGK